MTGFHAPHRAVFRHDPEFATTALPIPRSLRVEALLLSEDGLTILASSEGTHAACPLCGRRADRVHSRYVLTLADLPWATLSVRLRVAVRKFFCGNAACPRRIFGERLAGVAQTAARRMDRQRDALTVIAFACGGEAGARLAGDLGTALVKNSWLIRTLGEDDRRP